MKTIPARRAALYAAGAFALGLLGGAGASAAIEGPTVSTTDRAAIEAIVRDYILEHPEILPEGIERLQRKQAGKTIADNRKAIETPFAGAWAGAEKGDVVLVEFTDYACGFCRKSVPDIQRLLAEDKKLKVVWRELPIIGPESEPAARVALLAAKKGAYLRSHEAFYAGGQLNEAKVAAVAKTVGVDPAAGKAADIDAELGQNLQLARTLGVSGTPAFVIGDQMLSGAVGYEALKAAVEAARKKG
ncbi:DsbA family protein [Sphingomonas sp. ID0503]|uniref:DsbA family protein n=1 Tax=Sphingomonas sp. ID0503 TaxID=3399691 RepID=UPI003AFA6B07